MSAQYKIAVRVTPAQSKRWQEIAFNFGFAWGGARGATVQYVTDPWLVFHPFAKRIKWSANMLYSGAPLPQHQYSAETDAQQIVDWFKQTTGEQQMYMVVRVELPYNEELQRIALDAGWRWPHNRDVGAVYQVSSSTKALVFANPDKYEPNMGKVIRWTPNEIPGPEATAVFSYPEHAEYIRKALGAEKQKEEPMSNVNDGVVSVYVNGYPELSAAVQQMAFKNGWTWNNGHTGVERTEEHYLVLDTKRRKMFWERWSVGSSLDARKQFDDVAKLFTTPAVTPRLKQLQDAQAAGKFVVYVDSAQDFTLSAVELERIRSGRRSTNNFLCSLPNYVIIGEDVPMPPAQALLDTRKYELTLECRLPRSNEYYVNYLGTSIEFAYSAPSTGLKSRFNGLRWIVKAKKPAYVPHTINTVVLGVTVAQKEYPTRRHLVVGVTENEVQIGLVNYPFATALDRFVDVYGNPYGVKQ